MFDFFYLAGGLVVIVFCAGLLVDGSSSLAKKFGLSDLLIGLTVVALGTSAPEMTVNIFSALRGSSDVGIGSVIGSNIGNIFLILGVSSVIYPMKIMTNTKWKEIPFSLLAAVVLWIMANDKLINGEAHSDFISRGDGLILLCFMIIFFVYTFLMALKGGYTDSEDVNLIPLWKSLVFIAAGITGLVVGGKYMVEGAVNFARIAGINEKTIGLTIVAIGTSLPELATSIVAAFKKKSDIAIGNVVGSNIFNIFLILGSAIIVRPAPVSLGSNIDMLIALFAGLILFISTFTLKHRTIGRIEGGVFLIFYASYIFYLIKIQL